MKGIIVAAVLCVVCAAGMSQANLLLNSGWEDGTAANWSGGLGVADWCAMTGTYGAYNGSGDNATWYQSVTITPNEYYAAGLYFDSLSNYTNASTTLSILWFDGSGFEVGTPVSKSFSATASLDWTYLSVTGAAPSDAASARFQVSVSGAIVQDGACLAYDDTSFVAVPEPASVMLFGLSSLGLVAWRRLRK